MMNHPQLWDDLSHKFSVAEEPDYRALGDYDAHCLRHGAYVRRGEVPAPET